jgi:hypothetical protein
MRKVEILFRVVLVCLTLCTSGLLFGEGTKELQPFSAEPYYLLINRGGGLNVPFACYTPSTFTYQTGTTEADYRLNLNVCNLGESIKLGFRGNENNTFYRIKNPAGAVVFGPVPVPYLHSINEVTKPTATSLRFRTTAAHGY